MKLRQSGFTLIEIAIVLLIVTILLGYTVALFPRQQQLKQYRALNLEMDRVVEAIMGFAQVNGRLPCPALPATGGMENYDNDATPPDGCFEYGGFVPANTLGLSGRLNEDSLLLDPWGNPYRYYVTNVDFYGTQLSDFIMPGEMRLVGLVDSSDDGYIDLDGRYLICDGAGTTTDSLCTGAELGFGNPGVGGYAGAPFVLLSQGKNWNEAAAAGDELENAGSSTTTALGMAAGPSAMAYVLKDVDSNETTFVRRTTGFSENYDDVVRWGSPSVLFSRMIQAGQLP